MKPLWLQEQRKGLHLSADEQNAILSNQRSALERLIQNNGLDLTYYSSHFPLPLLNESDLHLQLLPHEKELDDTFCREIGKIVPYLTNSTIQGVEAYVRALDTAMLSIAKNASRKAILDKLAVHYVPVLLSQENGLIKTYYETSLNSTNLPALKSLLGTFRTIIQLMEDDGHRANLGTSPSPPKQNNFPIGGYSTRFEDYVLRIDGIRMDSMEMHNNQALQNERRRQFVSGLDENLRILVNPPGFDCHWHVFKQAYFNGFSRLYPSVPLFGKRPINSTGRKNNKNKNNTNHNSNTTNHNNNHTNKSSNNKKQGKKRTFHNKKGNNKNNTYTNPNFLQPNQHNNGNSKGNNNYKKNSNKYNKQINTIAAEVREQRSLLSSLIDKLSLFDIPRATLTVVCLMALCIPSSAWICQRNPPHYPLTFRQSTYKLDDIQSMDVSLMTELCKEEDYHAAVRVGDIILTDGSFFSRETFSEAVEPAKCTPFISYLNKSNDDVFLGRLTTDRLTAVGFDLLLDIYAYHHAFNESCPSAGDEERSIPLGRNVPVSPIRKRKRPDGFDVNNSPELSEMKQSNAIKTDRIRDLENEILRLHDKANLAYQALRDDQKKSDSLNSKILNLESELTKARDLATDANDQLIVTRKTMNDLKMELSDLKETHSNQLTLSEGTQNAIVAVQQAHKQKLASLKSEHENALQTSRKTHQSAIAALRKELSSACDNRIKAAESKATQSTLLQREQDKLAFQKEVERVKAECKREKDNELIHMRSIFDSQLEEVKKCIPATNDIKMETDNTQAYLEKISDQARTISSLQQVINAHDSKTLAHTPNFDPALCTSYNNFVTFLEHVKHLNVSDAMTTLPSSIVSLLTFISTIIGTRLLSMRRNRHNDQQYTLDTSPRLPTFNSLPTESSPLWKFGDGPVKNTINAILTEALPTLRWMLDGFPILVLLDTGASINVLHSSIVSRLTSSYTKRPISEDLIASSANGSSISLEANITIEIQIGNEKILFDCYVSPDINHDLIVGQPGLRSFGDFSLQWSSGTITLGSHKFSMNNTFPFRNTQEEFINPRSTTVLNPKIIDKPFGDGTPVYAITNPYFKGNNRLLTYNTASPVYNQRISYVIDNHGNNPVTIPRNTLLGYVTLIETISDSEIRITNNGYSSDEADICDRLPPYPSTNESNPLDKQSFLKLIRVPDSILDETTSVAFNTLLWKYREVFYEYNSSPGLYTGPEALELQTVPHDLPRPIRAPRYTLEKENEVARQVEDMLNNDMIEPSRTPYLSRINLVKKKNNAWRFVVDFRNINKLIQPQSHHIPRIDTILDKASGKAFYTSLDLKNGFHQLTLDKNSRYLTGFPTHMGIFHYKRIPMGLVGSPDFFNYVMENVFSDTNNFVYLDDILLTNDSVSEHLTNISSALDKAKRFGLRFSLDKCLFFQSSLEYLGFLISSEGIRPNPAKTEALSKKPIPRNEKELRSFLGAANYYRKHIPSYSSIANILYDCTSNFLWTSKHTEAFEQLKDAIIKACTLAPPRPSIPFTILTDASIQGIGSALMQEGRPIAFASRTLKKAELMYAPVQLEALGLVFALKSFSPYIYGKRTTILTDQSSLLSLMTKSDVSNILDRYKNYIMGFDLDIKYIKGTDNTVADYLSRTVFNLELTSTDSKYIDAFPPVTSYLQLPYNLSMFSNYLNEKERLTYPDCKINSRGKTRFFVPQLLRFLLLTRWHEHPLLGNHNGFDKGSAKFKELFFENHYALVLIDEFSKFVIIRRTPNLGAAAVIHILQEIIFLLGCPVILKSDNGPAFISHAFNEFCKTFGLQHHLVSAYNHQGNGIVERFNRTIRESIRLYKQTNLDDILWTSQYAHNFSYLTNQHGKPKEFILNTPDRWLNDTYSNNQLSGRKDLLIFMKHQLDPKKSTKEQDNKKTLKKGTIVFKRNPAAHKNDSQFDGPYIIMENIHGDSYLIQKSSQSGRPIGTPFKSNARLLKVAPQAMQQELKKIQQEEVQTPISDELTNKITQNEQPQRKRGRPKKIPAVVNKLPEKDAKDTRKRGRPRKNKRKENKDPAQTSTKKRGRPKKNIQLNETSSNVSNKL
ncbi:Reverse transcriptase domain and Integrase,catalytic core domain and Ribonuclease H-like domain and AT hook-like family and Aspartic peptidase domain-containing protein [Strongyloides ratti]|uniref:RNA-directed DNA polymerase n=1 Tax=Strongyloides ratti TaxID=34506 RepID=A0A090KVU9_STRRB|nr:Reverse transcriptase domain and Integrase,catalytic core domain and Ribonuclease H-like domain and AT hook-like family and Aspartic peptidase domain-containing protein [Strongyloides ratti]CEF61546.2 Reverse transcriptase domain and Integrase,catalytic core domain and Ribonuclease H-like domain and AT hook-like family and Aspartic peptidase domain-containing protein [Strongyloides ratti]